MGNDVYFQDRGNKNKNNILFFTKLKDKHISYIDTIPEKYKRKNYIIDKFNCKRRNVDL